MKRHIYLFGASGSGTTSLGKCLAARLGYRHVDADDYFWLPPKYSFTKERPPKQRVQMLRRVLSDEEAWVLSGSLTGWGEELFPLFDLAVLIYVPLDIRLERLKKREWQRYGERMLPGGDRYEAEQEFLSWAACYDTGEQSGRTFQKHKADLERFSCSTHQLENDVFETSLCQLLEWVK